MAQPALPQFVLASASKARRQLLISAGITPYVCPSNFDESQVTTQDPIQHVEALARCKGEVVAAQFPDALVLGCDSILSFDGQIHGKPKDASDARQRWRAMRGNIGDLYTGHALFPPGDTSPIIRSAVTHVHFAPIDEADLEAYASSDEPLHCAGGFAIDGRGGLFVEKLEGCHSNVMGLSLPLLRKMIALTGYRATDFW